MGSTDGYPGARGNLLFSPPRNGGGLIALIFDKRTATNLDAKSLALQFETGESVFSDEVDQFAELVHINRSFEMSGLIAMSSSSTIAIPRSALGRRFRWCRHDFRLLAFLVAHRALDSD